MKKMIFTAATALFLLAGSALTAQERQGRAPRQMNPEQMAKMRTEQLTKELGLNAEQSEKVYQLNLAQMQQMQQMREASKQQKQEDRKAMREQMRAGREQQKSEMKAILTDEQYKQWEQLEQQRREGHGQHPHRRPNGGFGGGGFEGGAGEGFGE